MSTQEYFEDNSIEIDEQKIGHLDLYAQDIYCRNLNVLNQSEAGLILCGMVLPYYLFTALQPVAPVGYGVCNGATYASVSYPGVNIVSPDLRNNFLRGGNITGTVYSTPEYTGSNDTTLVAGNIPRLQFNCQTSSAYSSPGIYVQANTGTDSLQPTQPMYVGNPSPSSFSNVPSSVSCVYIIKL